MIKENLTQTSLKDEKYSGLYDLAERTNSTKAFLQILKTIIIEVPKTLEQTKQYCKVILDTLWEVMIGLAVNYFESNNNSDYSTIGGNDYWNTMNPGQRI